MLREHFAQPWSRTAETGAATLNTFAQAREYLCCTLKRDQQS